MEPIAHFQLAFAAEQKCRQDAAAAFFARFDEDGTSREV